MASQPDRMESVGGWRICGARKLLACHDLLATLLVRCVVDHSAGAFQRMKSSEIYVESQHKDISAIFSRAPGITAAGVSSEVRFPDLLRDAQCDPTNIESFARAHDHLTADPRLDLQIAQLLGGPHCKPKRALTQDLARAN